MRRGAVVLAVALLVSAPLAACAGDEAPAADATGSVEATDVQASPESLVLELIRLREEGRPEDAARYFISKDIKVTEIESMTEVDASILCTSSSVDCTDPAYGFASYISGDECAGTTLQEAEAAGVEVDSDATLAEINGTSDYGHGCAFEVREVGGQWWIING